MARFYTEDEIRRLEANPYVINATDRFINFTAEFKQIFYSRYQETRKPKRILESLGFDIELLGYARIHSITMHVVKEYEARGYFSDLNMRQSGEISPESAAAYKIQYLEKNSPEQSKRMSIKKISSVSRKGIHP